MRRFMGGQTDAVTKMMVERPGAAGGKHFHSPIVETATAHSGPNRGLDFGEDRRKRFPGSLLRGVALAADRKRPGVIGRIPAEADAQVEDVQLSGVRYAIARWSSARTALKILAEVGERFAQGLHRDRLQDSVEIELVDSRLDVGLGRLVHRPIRLIGTGQHA